MTGLFCQLTNRSSPIVRLLLCSSLLCVNAAIAQQPSPGTASPVAGAPTESGLSVDALNTRLKTLQAQLDIPADDKAKQVDLLNQAIDAATRTQALQSESQRLTTEIGGAPARQAAIKDALAAPVASFEIEALQTKTPAPEAEAKLAQKETELTSARQHLQTLSDALARQRQRPEPVQAGLADSKTNLEKIAKELFQTPAANEPPGLTEARRLALQSRQQMRNAEIAAFEQELAVQDGRISLLSAELLLAQREVENLESALKAWQTVVQRQREAAASKKRQEAEAAEKALSAMPENIRELGKQNIALAQELETLTNKQNDTTRELTQAQAQLKEVDEDFSAVKERVELAGLNDTIALVLRKQHDALPSMREYRSFTRKIREQTSYSAGRQLDHQGTVRALADLSKAAALVIDASQPALSETLKANLLPVVSDALRKQKELASNLKDEYGRYITQLGKLDNAERTLVSKAEQFNQLIDEHLLWIRSTPPVSSSTLIAAAPAFARLLGPAQWLAVMRDLWRSTTTVPLAWLTAAAGFVFVFALRRHEKAALERTAAVIGNVSTDSLWSTLRAMLASIVLATSWPMLAVSIGWPLTLSSLSGPFARAVGSGLLAVALIGFGFRLLQVLIRDGGVGDAHFGWPSAARRDLRRHLRWLAIIVLPLGFIIWTIEGLDDEPTRASLGRVAFVLVMLALSGFIACVLRPNGPLFAALAERHQGPVVVRLRYLLAPSAATAPFLLAVLSIFGYHYSALQLQYRLQATAWIVLGLVLVIQSLMRWLVVSHRRLAHQQALEEIEKARESQAATKSSEDDEVVPIEFEEPEIDLESIQKQTGSLIRTVMGITALVSLWATWASVLPALNVLNEITFWHYPGKVDGVDGLVPVTLVDLATAVLIGVLTYLGTKNLPGALELAVLNRTSLDGGAKYAFTALCRYVIAGVGVILVCKNLGIEWSRLQWLVAALGVGLGFGLQEIVANFISGLILLFERPIRVGDIVTISGTSGTVSRIRIRATTITDWDRKEFIVPNKLFITGSVLNWTLSNEMNRIVINVGVAYGADTDRARELLLQVAREQPRILTDPAPAASFEGFGDNSLNLVLRCYMPNLDGRLGVITALHTAIDAAFKAAGIEISFPQRDLHIDTKQPVQVQMLPTQSSTQSSHRASSGDGQ